MRAKALRLTWVFILFCITNGFAQRSALDSLFKKLNTLSEEDTTYINTLAKIGVEYQHLNVDSMITIGNYMIKQAGKLSYDKGIGHGYKLKGIAYISLSNREKALLNDSLAIVYYKKANDPIGLGAVYNNMAVLFNSTGEYYTAKTYYEKSLAMRKQSGDIKGTGDSYNNLGNNLLALGRYSEAVEYLMKGLQIRKEINYTSGVVNSLMNLGNLYYYIGDQQKSELMYMECIRLAEKSGSFVNTGEIYNNIGALFYSKNRLDSAEFYFQKSLNASKKIDDYETILNAINNLAETKLSKKDFSGALQILNSAKQYIPDETNGESHIVINAKYAQYYKEIGNYSKAIESGNKALTKAKEIGAARLALETEQMMAEIYAAAGRYQDAYAMQKSAKILSDSILNEKTIKSISDIQYKFDIEQKEHEIDVLEKDQLYQTERNKKLTIAFTLSVFILAVLVIALYIVYKNIQKQKYLKQLIEEQHAILEQHNEFKDKVFTIIAHDLRSPVASTLTMFNLLRSGIITDEQFREAQHDITNQIRNMSFLLDNLLNWAKKQMKGKLETIPSLVNVHKVIKQNSSLLQDVYYKKQITINNQVDEQSKLTIDLDQFDFVIRNILANALKFSRDKGQVTISETITDTHYKLSITDQGIGMDELTLEKLFTPNTLIKHGANGEQGTGLGLNISKEFIELNQGKIEVSSILGKGTTLSISFKKEIYSV